MESIGLVAGLAGEAAALLGVSALAARLQRAYRKEAVSAQRLREIFHAMSIPSCCSRFWTTMTRARFSAAMPG